MTSSRIRIGDSWYVVAPSRDVVEIDDERQARGLLERFIDDSPGAAHDLVAIAEDIHGEYMLSRERALSVLARALARGDLRAVRLEDPPERLGRGTGVDVRDIHDPIDPAPSRLPGRADDHPAAPLARTWISFEVVDDLGDPLEGTFRIALDADVREGDLDDETRLYEDIREAADVRLLLERIQWDFDAPADAPRDEPAGPPVDGPIAEGSTTFEVTDDAGEPWPGQFTLRRGDEVVASGELTSGASDPIDGAGELALELTLDAPAG